MTSGSSPRGSSGGSNGRAWTCSSCSVTSRFLDGGGPPARWVRHGCTWHCLRCERERLRELGDEHLVTFELKADPRRTNSAIGKAAGLPVITVEHVRRRLLAEGEITSRNRPKPAQAPAQRPERQGSSKPKPKPRPRPSLAELHPRVVEELRANPRRTNRAIFVASGEPPLPSAIGIVRQLRRGLEQAGEIEVYRARGGRPHHRSKAGRKHRPAPSDSAPRTDR